MRILHLLIPILAAAPWAAAQTPAAQQPSASTAELSVIAAAIDSLYMANSAARVVVISPTAVLRSDVLRDEVSGTSASRDAAEDIGRRNAAPVDIRGVARIVSTRIPVVFADSGVLHALPRDPNAFWKAFFAAYPGAKGLVTVSLPGISADGQHAVLRIGMGCGPRCGSWGVAQLQRIGDRWHVTHYVIDRSS